MPHVWTVDLSAIERKMDLGLALIRRIKGVHAFSYANIPDATQ